MDVENRWSYGFVDVLKMGWRERRNSLCTHISSLETFHSVCEHRQTVHSAEPMPTTHSRLLSLFEALSYSLCWAELSCTVLCCVHVFVCYTQRSNVCWVSVCICWWRGRLCVHRKLACVCECVCMWRFAFVTCYRLAAVAIRSHKPLNPSFTHTRAHSFRSLESAGSAWATHSQEHKRSTCERVAVVNNNTKTYRNRCSCSSCAQYVFWPEYCRLTYTHTSTNKLFGSHRCVCSSMPLFSNTHATAYHMCLNQRFRFSSQSFLSCRKCIVRRQCSSFSLFFRSDMLGYLFIYSVLCAFNSFHVENWNKRTLKITINGVVPGTVAAAAAATAFTLEMHCYAMMNKCLFHFK